MSKDIKKILITNNLNEDQINCALDIIYEAFKQKIIHLELYTESKEKALRIYKDAVKSDQGIYAIKNNKIAGVLGYHYGKNKYFKIRFKTLRFEFGILGGLWRYCMSHIDDIHVKEKVLRIEAIAVSEKSRGKGIGTLLIKEAELHCIKHGFKSLILEVVDTNPKALALYESLGFKIRKIRTWGVLTKKAGFTKEIRMEKLLGELNGDKSKL